jgi:hypothetical protein
LLSDFSSSFEQKHQDSRFAFDLIRADGITGDGKAKRVSEMVLGVMTFEKQSLHVGDAFIQFWFQVFKAVQ